MPHVDKRLRALERACKEAQATLRMSKDQMRTDLSRSSHRVVRSFVRDLSTRTSHRFGFRGERALTVARDMGNLTKQRRASSLES